VDFGYPGCPPILGRRYRESSNSGVSETPTETFDKQVEHLHDLGVTTHRLVVENTELTEAIHDHFIKKSAS